jgi:hypothetical protein
MKKPIQIIFISIVFIIVYFLFFKRVLESFDLQQQQQQQNQNPVIQAIRAVEDNYLELQKQLIANNTIGNQYKSTPIPVILQKTKMELNSLEEEYRSHTITYSDVKDALKPYIKALNGIIQENSINIRNMRIDILMPDLQQEKSSNQYPIYKSKDEYSTS